MVKWCKNGNAIDVINNKNCFANKIFTFVGFMKQYHFLLWKAPLEAKLAFLGSFTSVPLFARWKNQDIFFFYKTSNMRFLLEKQLFILFLWKPFSFSPMASSSLNSSQKISYIWFTFHFLWGLRVGFSTILTAVKKVRSNRFRNSNPIPISVFWEDC